MFQKKKFVCLGQFLIDSSLGFTNLFENLASWAKNVQ